MAGAFPFLYGQKIQILEFFEIEVLTGLTKLVVPLIFDPSRVMVGGLTLGRIV